MAHQRQAAGDLAPHTLWFSPPGGDQSHRRVLTRQRVIAEALAVISADGVQALSIRALATRLGVVPGASGNDACRTRNRGEHVARTSRLE